ncbi:MAG: hypothetical protein WC998_01665 [Candidatus Paceibacterota bacterium]|jgi:hypothetical protein
MLKVSGLIKDSTIISDFCAKKGYEKELRNPTTGEPYPNPESEVDYFDRIITNYINTIVNDQRKEKAEKALKYDKAEL